MATSKLGLPSSEFIADGESGTVSGEGGLAAVPESVTRVMMGQPGSQRTSTEATNITITEEELQVLLNSIKAGKQFGKPPESFGIAIIADGVPFSDSEPQCAEDPQNPGSYTYNYDGTIKLGIELAKIFPDANIRIRPRNEQVQHMQVNPDKYANIRIRSLRGKFSFASNPHAWTADYVDEEFAFYACLSRETHQANWRVDDRSYGLPAYPTHG